MDGFVDNLESLTSGNLGAMAMPTEDEPYDDVKFVSRVTPPAGRYTLQLPEDIKVGAWPESDKGPGSIELSFDPVKVIAADGEPGAGLEIRFVNVSTRLIGGNCSSATDLLNRLGISPFPTDIEGWRDTAAQLSGQVVSGVYCDWVCRAPKDTKTPEALKALRTFLKSQRLKVTDPKARKIVLRGMKNFPVKTASTDDESAIYHSKLIYGGPENSIGPAFQGELLTLYANLVPTLRGFALTPEERAEREATV